MRLQCGSCVAIVVLAIIGCAHSVPLATASSGAAFSYSLGGLDEALQVGAAGSACSDAAAAPASGDPSGEMDFTLATRPMPLVAKDGRCRHLGTFIHTQAIRDTVRAGPCIGMLKHPQRSHVLVLRETEVGGVWLARALDTADENTGWRRDPAYLLVHDEESLRAHPTFERFEAIAARADRSVAGVLQSCDVWDEIEPRIVERETEAALSSYRALPADVEVPDLIQPLLALRGVPRDHPRIRDVDAALVDLRRRWRVKVGADFDGIGSLRYWSDVACALRGPCDQAGGAARDHAVKLREQIAFHRQLTNPGPRIPFDEACRSGGAPVLRDLPIVTALNADTVTSLEKALADCQLYRSALHGGSTYRLQMRYDGESEWVVTPSPNVFIHAAHTSPEVLLYLIRRSAPEFLAMPVHPVTPLSERGPGQGSTLMAYIVRTLCGEADLRGFGLKNIAGYRKLSGAECAEVITALREAVEPTSEEWSMVCRSELAEVRALNPPVPPPPGDPFPLGSVAEARPRLDMGFSTVTVRAKCGDHYLVENRGLHGGQTFVATKENVLDAATAAAQSRKEYESRIRREQLANEERERAAESAGRQAQADAEAVARGEASYVFDATDRDYEQQIGVIDQQIGNLLRLAGVGSAASGVTGDVRCTTGTHDCTYDRQGGGESGSSAIRNTAIREQVRDLELKRSILQSEWASYRRKKILGR